MDKDHALEEMMGKLGDFGRYQCFQFILHILAAMTAGMHMLSLVTVAAVPEHRCWINGTDSNNSAAWNAPEIIASIPKQSSGLLHNCLMYNAENETVPCNKWVYDTRYRTSSRAIEWDLVCDRRWMGALTQTVFMLGVLTGSFVLGSLADKVGRKTIFCWSAVLQLLFGVTVAFTPEFWSFLVFRFFYGMFGCAGCYNTAFVLTLEMVGTSKRTVCGMGFPAAFAVGVILVAAWGAVIDDRQILQVVYGLHSVVIIPHLWIMDESPRWLWAQGRVKEAAKIVEKALRYNKSSDTVDVSDIATERKVKVFKDHTRSSPNIGDLFKTPNLRNRSLILCFCYFANSLVYYGLSLGSGNFSGNPYVVIGIIGFVDLPSLAFVIYTLDIWGRRAVISSFMLLGGSTCVIAPFIHFKTISTVIIISGKLFIAGSFSIVYNYSAELLPTVVRNSAIGLGTTCARLSAALTPFITILDTFDPKIPAVIFGFVALVSGFLCLFLPETMNQPMPQTLADGENFRKGDSCFQSCFGKSTSKESSDSNERAECMIPLNDASDFTSGKRE